MKQINAKVTAHAFNKKWMVECSICGPLSVASWATVDSVCTAHMQTHGAQVVTR